MLALLLSSDKIGWEDSIKKYVPELKDDAWDDVTISSLAGHMSGLGRFGYVGDLSVIPSFVPAQFGIQPVDNILPGCDLVPGGPVCTRQEVVDMFNDLVETPRSPNTGPSYSNIGFNLLGMALANAHSKTFEEVIQDLILDPLKLSKSTFVPPSSDTEAILPNPGDFWLTSNFANFNPTGGLWTTPTELLAFMRAILNHKLLSPAKTRKWMQPLSFLPSLHQLIGAPWEILRPDDLDITYKRPITIFTKPGGVAGYAGYGIVVPEYNMAISIIVAGDQAGQSVQDLMPIVMKVLIPFADAHAREQAEMKYAGTYTLPDSDNTITITLDNGPGLSITSFNMNGVPVLRSLAALIGAKPELFSARLYPTDPDSLGTEKEFWRIRLDNTDTPNGFADAKSAAWNGVDQYRYMRQPLDAVNFVMENDNAVGIELLGWRTTLRRII